MAGLKFAFYSGKNSYCRAAPQLKPPAATQERQAQDCNARIQQIWATELALLDSNNATTFYYFILVVQTQYKIIFFTYIRKLTVRIYILNSLTIRAI